MSWLRLNEKVLLELEVVFCIGDNRLDWRLRGDFYWVLCVWLVRYFFWLVCYRGISCLVFLLLFCREILGFKEGNDGWSWNGWGRFFGFLRIGIDFEGWLEFRRTEMGVWWVLSVFFLSCVFCLFLGLF